MIIKDYIEYLKTLDQDLEVWTFWDESGECFPKKKFPKIETVALINKTFSKGKRWEFKSTVFDDKIFKEKQVLMIQ